MMTDDGTFLCAAFLCDIGDGYVYYDDENSITDDVGCYCDDVFSPDKDLVYCVFFSRLFFRCFSTASGN